MLSRGFVIFGIHKHENYSCQKRKKGHFEDICVYFGPRKEENMFLIREPYRKKNYLFISF